MKRIFFAILAALMPNFLLGMNHNITSVHDMPIVKIEKIENKTRFPIALGKEGIFHLIQPNKTFHLKKYHDDSDVLMTKSDTGFSNPEKIILYNGNELGKSDKSYLQLSFQKKPLNHKKWLFEATLKHCKNNFICKQLSKNAHYSKKYKKFNPKTDKDGKSLLDSFTFKIILKGKDLDESEIKLVKKEKIKSKPDTYVYEHGTRPEQTTRDRSQTVGLPLEVINKITNSKVSEPEKLEKPEIRSAIYKKLELSKDAGPYDILEIDQSADQAEIQDAYMKKVVQWIHDTNKDEIKELLNWAYKSLRE